MKLFKRKHKCKYGDLKSIAYWHGGKGEWIWSMTLSQCGTCETYFTMSDDAGGCATAPTENADDIIEKILTGKLTGQIVLQ